MSQVFISYRQTDVEHRQRVRTFAGRLRDSGIDVILDQFFLDDHPEGPAEGWDKWSSDCALSTEYVLIIGTKDWFDCFTKTQPRGTGLGAACEADDIRDRIYEAGGVINNIRVVLFDDAEATHIPAKLRRYHRFHGERDIENIVRWLRGMIYTDDKPRTSIPHNLPSLQPFFGREEELKQIADALDPESRTWGALIDGPGGMGKTSLAVRAAYDAPLGSFDKIVFVSLKSRELDDDGVRDLSGFLISGLAELLNELARELGHDEITKATDDKRPRMLLDVLRGKRALLVLDNLENLLKSERDIIFNFVKRLPPGCKAILTSRQRIGSAAEELILEKLSERAALATIAKLAESNSALAKTTEAERRALYEQTGGKPLLLRWTAGQIGRGSCLTLPDAIDYLRSCPDGNNPLEFIFGDIVEGFNDAETSVLATLAHFWLPARVEHLTKVAQYSEVDTDCALRNLVNRSLVILSDELKTFRLVPLVANFIKKKRSKVVEATGERLEKLAHELALENGYKKSERFHLLDADWPIVSAALPRFLTGPNDRLQVVCHSLSVFLEFTGRWDEWLVLSIDAENRAVALNDFLNAIYQAGRAGWVYCLRQQAPKVLDCARRAETYCQKANAGAREKAAAISLRATGHRLAKDYLASIHAYREALDLQRTLKTESADIVITLGSLAAAEHQFGEVDSAERDYREALRIARAVDYPEGVASSTGNLAELALKREDWPEAEALALEALHLAEIVGRLELIASNCLRLAQTRLARCKKAEALSYAERAVEIFTKLNSPRLEGAQTTLAQCASDIVAD